MIGDKEAEETYILFKRVIRCAEYLSSCIDCEPYWGRGGVGRVDMVNGGIMPYEQALELYKTELRDALRDSNSHLYRVGQWVDYVDPC